MRQTKNNRAAQTPAANRNYKSTVFAMLFGDRERLLRLYNAISGKNYQNPEALEINTLENAIYMGMKNDLSFLIDDRLSLYEHQSTVNPNMPLRLSDLYTVKTKEVQLELTAVLLNINRNHNRELMEACQDLKDYAEYVDRVRKYAGEQPLAEAVECAITECIREGILKEFLEKNRAEVKTIPEGRESFFKSGQGVGGGITLMS